MRRTLLIILSIFVLCNVKAQKLIPGNVAADAEDVVLDETNKTFIPPRERKVLKSGTKANLHMKTFPDDTQKAFQKTVSIWKDLIQSVTINVNASWKSLDGKVPSTGKASLFCQNFDDVPGPCVYYPVAPSEKLSDENTPENKFGLGTGTAILHEITHGLGFSDFLKADNNTEHSGNSKLRLTLTKETVYQANTNYNYKKQVNLTRIEPDISLINMIKNNSSKRITEKTLKTKFLLL